jgi:hypothetical protein
LHSGQECVFCLQEKIESLLILADYRFFATKKPRRSEAVKSELKKKEKGDEQPGVVKRPQVAFVPPSFRLFRIAFRAACLLVAGSNGPEIPTNKPLESGPGAERQSR